MINTDDLRAAGAARRAALSEKVAEAVMYRGGAHGFATRSADTMGAGTTRRQVAFPAQYRAQLIEHDGKQFHEVSGYASAYEHKYEMWDMFGPYEESVAAGAGTRSLAGNPDVVFLVNHTGLAMARTINGSLSLKEDDHGLGDTGLLNAERQDVKDLVHGIEDGVITEQSFAFYIEEGWWNDDFTEFRIVDYEINRGDVSAVNYGANPATDISARQRTILAELRYAPTGVRRAAAAMLANTPVERALERALDAAIERGAPAQAQRSRTYYEALLATWEAEA